MRRWKLEYEKVVKTSEDCFLICVICFDGTNCLDYSTCLHRALVGKDPSSTIVVDLHDGQDPYEVGVNELKVLGEAVVEDATMNEAKSLFDDMCRRSKC